MPRNGLTLRHLSLDTGRGVWQPQPLQTGGYTEEQLEDGRKMAAASEMYGVLIECDNAFVAWQVGQIPGRPEDILALIQKVRAVLAKADGKEAANV